MQTITRIRKRRGRPRRATLFQRIVGIETARLPGAVAGRCPFCGATAIGHATEHLRDGSKVKALRCMTCGARGPEGRDRPRARDLWWYGYRERYDTAIEPDDE